MTEEEQIDALKAQVNCLLGYLKEISEYWNGDTNEIVMKDACYQALNVSQEALERIPEQCLAKVKAKAIKEAIQSCSSSIKYGDMCEAKCLQFYADQLREQAK